MGFVNFVLAISPIAFVLVGILIMRASAMKASVLALLWTMLLALTYFNPGGLSFTANVDIFDALVWKGIKEGGKIVFMVFGAFVILNMLRHTGAMDDVKHTVARISGADRRVQLMIIGMFVPIFLEGAAGAGAPAAIAAPFLVTLGFDPVTAIACALLGDATPGSWGGAGLTTINGGAALVEAGISTNALNSAMVGRFHMFGVLIIPFIMIAIAFGRKGFKGIIPYLCYVGVTTCLVMFFLSNVVGPEITSLGTGLIAIVLSVAYIRLFKINTPDEYKYTHPVDAKTRYSAFQAISPYIYMIIMLPAVRYGAPIVIENGFALICTFGYIFWVDCVIIICGILGAYTLRVSRHDYFKILSKTVSHVMPVLVTMGSLLILAYIMQSKTTGMMNLIADNIAEIAGIFYPAAAVVIGSMGSFITGTGLGSNIMFAGMHIEAAHALSMNPITVFAAQNAGGALGNLICPNNAVAACATLGEVGNEGAVLKKAVAAFCVIVIVYMILSMLYTHVLFTNFGQAITAM